ncbi:MAG: LysR family transcriptional regulator [Duodenibacillus sp.]|nr:LysR family transcriptional regulator [Duodenibacillus sp.]
MPSSPLESLPSWRAFVEVARAGSFQDAAPALGVDRSAVSRRIAALEAALGYPLFAARGKRLALTPRGEAALANARDLLGHARLALERIAAGQAAPGRGLHILASPGFSGAFLRRAVVEFQRLRPDCIFEIESLRQNDGTAFRQIGRGIDMLVTASRTEHAGLAAHLVSRHPKLCLASPGLVRRRGPIEQPSDLEGLALAGNPHFKAGLRLVRREDGAVYEGRLGFRLFSDNSLLLAEWAAAGAGVFIGCPSTIALDYIRQGSLAPVLSHWQLPELTGWAYTSAADADDPDSTVMRFIGLLTELNAQAIAIARREARAHRLEVGENPEA